MYMFPGQLGSSFQQEAAPGTRSVAVIAAVSLTVAAAAGISALKGFESAAQLEANPSVEVAQDYQSAMGRVEDKAPPALAYRVCRDEADFSPACREREEVSQTVTQIRQYSSLGLFLALCSTGIFAAAGTRLFRGPQP